MKIHKKFGLGLGLLAVLLGLATLMPTKAYAAAGATQNDVKACSGNLQFVSIAEIDCTYTPEGQTTPETVKFADIQPDDSDTSIGTNLVHKLNYAWTPSMPFCNRGNTPGAGIFRDGPYYEQGLTVLAIGGSRSLQVGDAGKSLKVRVVLGYSSPSGSSCSPYDTGGPNKTADVDLTGAATAGIANLLQFENNGNSVAHLSVVTKGDLAGKSYALSGYQGSSTGVGKVFVYTSGYTAGAAKCAGDVVIASVNGNSATATRYKLTDTNDVDKSGYADLISFLADKTYRTTGCGADHGETNFGSIGGNGFAILGIPPSSITPPPCDPAVDPTCTTVPPPGSVTGSNDACFSSGWALSWIACPVITTAQGLANSMYGFVEDQLKFCVSQSTTDTRCKGGDSLGPQHDSVHNVWNNFRILVSGLVVILLLVMVISQAIGTGPFDAYTVKKMLPRLVIGVILIQISWPMFSWVVNTVDDLGRGLADIIYAPFGGANALNLNEVMKPFTSGTAEVFNWLGFLGIAIGAVIAPFLMLGVILTVLVAIFVGFLTLLFRKIIIILALIFVPVALISWMMPNDGLRKYWKLWWDNFSKALMMFPLIIAIIAAGRIFAKIGSGQQDFVGFFIVLIGFFGPLFFLPKTFKWGGTIMQSAGSAISSAGQKGLKKPKEFLGERQKGWSAERTRQSQERFSKNVGFNPRRFWRRPIDLVKSGTVDPTLWGRRREQAIRGYRAAGVESLDTDIKAASQDFSQLAAQAANDPEYGGHDQLARDVGTARIGETIKFKDRDDVQRSVIVTAAMKEAGMDAMAKYGTDRTFRELAGELDRLNHSEDIEEQVMAERFRDRNVATLKPKMDYLYRGQSKAPHGSDTIPDWAPDPDTGAMGLRGPITSRVDALTPEAFAQMEAPELEAMLAGLSHVANTHADAAARTAAEGYLRTIYTHYQAALDNNQVSRAMGPSLNQAMKVHLDRIDPDVPAARAGRNASRTRDGLTTDIDQVPTIMTATTDAIAARIGIDGTLQPRSAPGPAGAGGAGPVIVPGPGAVGPAPGATVVPGSPHERIITGTDYDIQNDINTRPGGWHGFSDDEVIHIYNHRTGDLKAQAENDLRRRGLIT